MLSKIDLGLQMDKKEYKDKMGVLEGKLEALGQAIKDMRIPVIIMFEGWSSSGKGTLIGKVVHPLDPRCFNVYTMSKLNEESIMRPFLWRYWIKTPEKGRIAIFDKSWHRIVLPEGISKHRLSETEVDGFFYDVNAFEKQLTDDGILIIKFFLHISKDEQKRRLKNLEKNPSTKWRVNEDDWKQNNDYEKYLNIFDQMIMQTESSWEIIEADDKRYAANKVISTIIDRITKEIETRQAGISIKRVDEQGRADSILASYKQNKGISDNEYKQKLENYQKQILDLTNMLYIKRKAVVIAYEGWDAAGKGGNIKRLTESIDPRAYEVVPINAPTAEELAHHYLWRFYNKLPKDGHIAIFDRTWYGRVLVERIENLCSQAEWARAYREINDMERHLANHGNIILKFWLQIDKSEQLARFKDRQEDELKQYKITDDDWRNREKWDLYEDAINDMLAKTSTDYAPWTVIESNSKKYARIKVLEHVIEVLRKRLL